MKRMNRFLGQFRKDFQNIQLPNMPSINQDPNHDNPRFNNRAPQMKQDILRDKIP